jgi:Reverse transcriptase (RNA-dependent DNA polymerase)
MVIFLAELNKLQLWGADVSSAYLEADTKEKVYIIAGDEFGKLSGNTLIIEKALYGLRTSGLRWHEKFTDILRDIGFVNCIAEPDIWMRKQQDHLRIYWSVC